MKKLTSLILCMLLLVSNISNVFASTITLTVAVDSPTYLPGSTVNIAGTIVEDGKAGKGYNPTLVVEDPYGNREFFSQWSDSEIDQNGNFTTFYTLNQDAPKGTYKVTISAASQTKVATFNVVSSLAEVTVVANKSQYLLSDSVIINGVVSQGGQAVPVTDVTVVFSKDGSQLKADQVLTNGQGQYQSFYNFTTNDSIGTYSVKVKALGSEKELTFTVVRPGTPPVIPPGPPTVTPPPGTPPGNGEITGDFKKDDAKGEATLVVDDKKLEAELQDASKSTVTVDLSTVVDEKTKSVNTQLSSSSLQKVADSKKSFIFKTNSETLSFPAGVLGDIAKTSPTTIMFTVERKAAKDVTAAQGKKIISDILDFSIVLEKDGIKRMHSTFTEKVKVDVSVKGKTFTDKRKAAAYYLNEGTGKWEYVGGKISGETFSFTTDHFSQYAIIENNKSFTDVKGLWAQNEIEVLASRDIIAGLTVDKFGPDSDVTRAQFAVLLARALNLPKAAYKGTFSDLTEKDTWAVLEVEAANRAGIVSGMTKDTFNPNAKITREQMAAMLVRAIEYKDKTLLTNLKPSGSFKDEGKISSFAKSHVEKATALGLIYGYKNQNFGPKDNTNRAQTAVVLYRLLTKLKEIQ